MKFIDKQDDLSIGIFDIIENRFQTFLKLTTIFCTCDKCTHIQCKQFLIFQSFRDISTDDPLCESFDNSRLTDTRLTDQNRVVLCLSGKDADYITDLCVTSDHRIKLLVSRTFYHIVSIFFQCVISCLRVIGYHSLVSSYR